jgi:hypothetical protein
MTGLELAALITVALWLAVLSLVVVLCVRQIGILSVGALARPPDRESSDDGLLIGQRVPHQVRGLLPDVEQLSYLLFLEAGCGPCRELVDDLGRATLDLPITVILRGGGPSADAVTALLPPSASVIRDPEAMEVAERLEVEITPSVLEVERGFITGKGVLRGLFDLESLARARQANGDRVVSEMVEAAGLNVEVFDGAVRSSN